MKEATCHIKYLETRIKKKQISLKFQENIVASVALNVKTVFIKSISQKFEIKIDITHKRIKVIKLYSL